MPFGMGKMMRVMGKIPGALTLMKPMFPILFPKLLPMMMPKVMPHHVETGRGNDTNAGLHERANARTDAESHGKPYASYD